MYRDRASWYARDEKWAQNVFDLGLTDEAIAAMQTLVARFPDEARLHLSLAMMNVTVGRVEEGAADAERALDAAPEDAIVMFRAATAIRWTNTERARALLERCKPGMPDVVAPDVAHLEGLIAHDEGRVDEAVRHFERGFRDEPGVIGLGATSRSPTSSRTARAMPWT
jgi:hypothetical protein